MHATAPVLLFAASCLVTSAVLPEASAAPVPTGVAVQAANQLARGFDVPTRASSFTQLAQLREAAPQTMAGYSRALFPHWRDASAWGWPVAPNNRCDARNAALYRDGVGVRINARCTVVSGSWLDPYTAVRYTNKASMDIDHLVPLALAWRDGARSWTPKLRTQYANDPLVLVSVKDTVNQAKGDKGADLWKPPNRAAWCLYAKRYTAIKTRYDLTVTGGERSALVTMLDTCTR